MRVYIAAPYAARDWLLPFADELSILDFEVTSTWLTETVPAEGEYLGAAIAQTDEQVRQHCRNDFFDLDRSDVVIAFTGNAAQSLGVSAGPTSLHTGGRHVEVGYALARGIYVIIVGDPENVFHRGACKVVPNWHRAMIALIRYSLGVASDG